MSLTDVDRHSNLSTMGDMGSKLPASPLRPRWVAGSQVEVAWGPRYNVSGSQLSCCFLWNFSDRSSLAHSTVVGISIAFARPTIQWA